MLSSLLAVQAEASSRRLLRLPLLLRILLLLWLIYQSCEQDCCHAIPMRPSLNTPADFQLACMPASLLASLALLTSCALPFRLPAGQLHGIRHPYILAANRRPACALFPGRAASVPVVGHIPPRAAWPLNRWLRVGAGAHGGQLHLAMRCCIVCVPLHAAVPAGAVQVEPR